MSFIGKAQAEVRNAILDGFYGKVPEGILVEVEAECGNQLDEWGVQDHPDIDPDQRGGLGFATGGTALRARIGSQAGFWKHMNAVRVKQRRLAWDGILLEEVYEALAEEDPARLRAELIQVAAVAVSWIENIDRREAAK